MLKLQTFAAGAALSILLAVTATAQTTPPATTPPAMTPAAPAPKAGAPTTAPAATTPATTMPAPAVTAPAAKKKAAAAKERTPESLACSKEADEKNIHGKPARGNFMRKCKADAAKAAKAAAKKS